MEIDLNLVRALLLWAEKGDFFSDVPGYEQQEDAVKYHKGILMDRGFFVGRMLKNATRPTDIPQNVVVRGLGNIGREWVELIRLDSDWEEQKQQVLQSLL